MTIQEGDLAPEFELPRDGGGSVGIGPGASGPAVLYFYPKDDTSGCTREAIDFTGLMPQFRRLGVDVIGVSPDSARSHDRFRDKHALAVTLAADETHAVAEAFGVWVSKSMYGRSYMGVERTTFLIGPDRRVARVWRKVKVPGHAEDVLEAAREMMCRQAARARQVRPGAGECP